MMYTFALRVSLRFGRTPIPSQLDDETLYASCFTWVRGCIPSFTFDRVVSGVGHPAPIPRITVDSLIGKITTPKGTVIHTGNGDTR